MTEAAPRRAAREIAHHPAARIGARAGYAANGVVHALIGAIALVIAFGGDGESDQAGAFKAIAAAPLGFAALWVLAIALWALGTWHLAAGVLARGRDDAKGFVKKWGQRISEWGQSAIFLALGFIAASVALGARPDAEDAAEDASRGVLTVPGGPFVLGLVGIGIGIGGVAFVVMGARRSFRNKMDIPDTALGRTATVLGGVGFVAKGIALVIIGVLLTVAAVTVDASAAGGLDGALQTLLGMMLGPALVAPVGVGLIAYGVFCAFRARYAIL